MLPKMSKRKSPIEGQLVLGQEPPPNYPVTYGEAGSYVDVAARAHYLIQALDAISQRNIRDGFSVAGFTMPHSEKVWSTYQENTEQVLKGAARNRGDYQQILRLSFWQATGFSALRGSGLIREEQIDPRAGKMWRDFNDQFGHPSKRKARNKYKKQLEGQLDWSIEVIETGLKDNLAA
jgi:hypothetical protein